MLPIPGPQKRRADADGVSIASGNQPEPDSPPARDEASRFAQNLNLQRLSPDPEFRGYFQWLSAFKPGGATRRVVPKGLGRRPGSPERGYGGETHDHQHRCAFAGENAPPLNAGPRHFPRQTLR